MLSREATWDEENRMEQMVTNLGGVREYCNDVKKVAPKHPTQADSFTLLPLGILSFVSIRVK